MLEAPFVSVGHDIKKRKVGTEKCLGLRTWLLRSENISKKKFESDPLANSVMKTRPRALP